MDGIIALAQSKRFWMLVAGLIVAFGNLLFGMNLDPQRVLAVLMVLSAWIIGESNRPAVRKTELRIFKLPTVVMAMLALGLCVGCSPKREPTPAPEPLTAVEAVTQSQLKLLATGYGKAFGDVADQVMSGQVNDTSKMRDALVASTRAARLDAEVPVLDELNARFPQNDAGEWADKESVARYLQSIRDAYLRLDRRLTK